jgi:hypothetical protein
MRSDPRRVGPVGGIAIWATLALGLVSCAGNESERLFRECVTSKGEAYEQAASLLLAQEDVDEYLAQIRMRQAPDEPEGRICAILTARREHPSVFEAYRALIQDLRNRRPLEGMKGSPGLLGSPIQEFMFEGPRSKWITKPGEPKLTKFGWESETVRVEKYTAEEVAAGRARNEAARHAVLEHFLKHLGEASEYERLELLDLVLQYWVNRKQRFSTRGERWNNDLIEGLMEDESQPWPVRIQASLYLTKERRKDVLALLCSAFESADTSDRDRNYRFLADAGTILATLGAREDIARLTKLRDVPPWKRMLIERAAEEWPTYHEE